MARAAIFANHKCGDWLVWQRNSEPRFCGLLLLVGGLRDCRHRVLQVPIGIATRSEPCQQQHTGNDANHLRPASPRSLGFRAVNLHCPKRAAAIASGRYRPRGRCWWRTVSAMDVHCRLRGQSRGGLGCRGSDDCRLCLRNRGRRSCRIVGRQGLNSVVGWGRRRLHRAEHSSDVTQRTTSLSGVLSIPTVIRDSLLMAH